VVSVIYKVKPLKLAIKGLPSNGRVVAQLGNCVYLNHYTMPQKLVMSRKELKAEGLEALKTAETLEKTRQKYGLLKALIGANVYCGICDWSTDRYLAECGSLVTRT
jgi:hypothetical protein